MAKTQNRISKKQENKGARGILDLTSTLGQTLRAFEGIYSKPLPECDGLTVEGWMSAHGVERFVTAKGVKKNYTPTLLMEGWHEGMKNGKQAYIFKNVAAKYGVAESEEEIMSGDIKAQYRVFTKEEAEKIDGKPLSRYMLQPVAANKWSVGTILKGLKQGNNFQKEEEKMLLSEIEWEKIENVYVVMYEERIDAAGRKETVRKVVEVNKAQVTF